MRFFKGEGKPVNTGETKQNSEITETSPLSEGDKLLEVRKEHVKEIERPLDDCDILVVGIAARSGSSSVFRSLSQSLREKGVLVAEFDASAGDSDLDDEIESAFDELEYSETENTDQDLVVIIEEAGNLLPRPDQSEKEMDRRREEQLSYSREKIEEQKKKGRQVKLVFAVHDFYGNDGEGGTKKLSRWLGNVFESQNPEISDEQLECVDSEGLGEIFDILSERVGLPTEFNERKSEIVSLCTTPQDVSRLVSKYNQSMKEGKKGPEAWKEAVGVLSDFKGRADHESLIRTTGGQKMWTMMRRVAEVGSVPLEELTNEEMKLYERYKKFHLLEESDGQLSINGKAMADLVKERPNLFTRS